MKEKPKSLLRSFCLDGSILGLKYFYLYPDKPSRIFWAVFMVLNLYAALLLTWRLYQRFGAMPTRINIENHFEPIAGLPFPAITICSPNQFTYNALEYFQKTLVNGNLSINLETALPQVLGFYHFSKSEPEVLAHLQTLIELNRYTVPEVISLMTLSCDEFLVSCFFKMRRYPHCKGLFHPVLTKHGPCCIFNSPYSYKTNRKNEYDSKMSPHLVEVTGLGAGLTVITDFRPWDAVDNTVHYAGAARIMFTDWTEFPSDDESVLVPPNTESFHLMRATASYCSDDVKELSPNIRKCLFENERHLPYFYEYRNSDCDLLCLIQAVEARCHCMLFYIPHFRVSELCGVDSIHCIIEAKLNLNEWMEGDRCECPRDCDSRQYRVDVTVGNTNGLSYAHASRYKGFQFNKSTSIMHFIFPQSTYEKQKQETVMSYTTLASNVGGVFGLCVGGSAVSILEMLFYSYLALKRSMQRRLRRSRLQTTWFYYE